MRARLKVSRAGVELIKSFEGLRQTATRLPDGRWTLGYGHTFSAREGARVTQEDADALLRFDLLPIVDAINNQVVTPLNQNQFDALVSFCFNIGVENFAASSVLKRINEGRLNEAAQAMDAWRSAEFNGQTYVLAPLIRRRAAEKSLFLTPNDIDQASVMTMQPVEDVNASLVDDPAPPPASLRQIIDLGAYTPAPAPVVETTAAIPPRDEQGLDAEQRARSERQQQALALIAQARQELARLEDKQREDEAAETSRIEASKMEAAKAAVADEAEKMRKTEAAAALMRLYSPYGGGALGRPLTVPRPVTQPLFEGFVHYSVMSPGSAESTPIDIASRPENLSPAPDSLQTLQTEPEAPAETSVEAPLQTPLEAPTPLDESEHPDAAVPPPQSAPEADAQADLGVFDESFGDHAGWALNGGRIAMSSDTEAPKRASLWTMIVSTFWWVFVSALGLGCLGVAAGAYYKSRDAMVIRNGAVPDYMTGSVVMAAVGILCVSISLWLIMKRLGGLKD